VDRAWQRRLTYPLATAASVHRVLVLRWCRARGPTRRNRG